MFAPSTRRTRTFTARTFAIRAGALGVGLALVMSLHAHAAPDTVGTPPIERLFVSGHSLTDPPLPAYLASIAASQGTPLQWNMQSIAGSPIRVRTEGAGPAAGPPQGGSVLSGGNERIERGGRNPADAYGHGANREGRNLDVLAEWRSPKTVSGGLYDALLVAEQHGVLTALTFQDTPTALADIHRRFTEANPKGRVWFYESWLDVDDKDDPRRWIAYERAASPVWQCVALRSRQMLEAAGVPSTIEAVPSGAALAALVERVTTQRVDGVTGATVRETMNRLFADDVHLTPLGHYYMASVVYAVMWARSPEGAAVPTSLDEIAARNLQREAWTFVTAWRSRRVTVDAAACRDALKSDFIGRHWGYVRDTSWTREHGRPGAYWRWARQMIAWHLRVRRGSDAHPFGG
jgi:hypothetical protein